MSAKQRWGVGFAAVLLVCAAWVVLTERSGDRGIVGSPVADGPARQKGGDPVLSEPPGELHNRVVEAAAAPPTDVSAPPPTEGMDPLVAAKEELAFLATESLYGGMYVNTVLEHGLVIASLPVEDRLDFEYEDDDAFAYAITGLPDGLRAHFKIGMKPYTENGREYRYLQMVMDMPLNEPEYADGVLREGSTASFTVSYDTADPNTPTRFALMLQRDVDLSASVEAGIDAYHGVYSQGTLYWHDLLDGRLSARTFGIFDGNPVTGDAYPAVRPAVGDVLVDSELLGRVLVQLQENLKSVKGEQ